ncbi:hypothetical protein [Egicoccus halophilus]|uniref:Uncharacterized protein n=1 Tax=Egicoccus halophilus TaxID=1670830 RepID=A0A8J3AAG9_9ACTN|nr:hypothetical protein [Egicoccus halophilus]GGI02944.1 hypothetical protein GCM10011354_02080 [Egicoccus halophilus]
MDGAASWLRAEADRVLELHESGRRSAARETCESLRDAAAAAAALDPDDPVVRETVFFADFELALLLTEEGELEAAAQAYQRAASAPDRR